VVLPGSALDDGEHHGGVVAEGAGRRTADRLVRLQGAFNGLGIVVGSVLGLLFAFLVAAMGDPNGQHHYVEIMLPGFVVGAIIGFVTQKTGKAARTEASLQH
jgi:hypothetical protein